MEEAKDDRPAYKFMADQHAEGKRLDHFCAEQLDGLSRTRVKKLIDAGSITVNGRISQANYRMRTGDQVEAIVGEVPQFRLIPEPIAIKIVYEDEFLLVIDKPAGMVVHPAVGNWTGTLMNALLHYLQQSCQHGLKGKPGLVHRLDKNTSGLLLAAKDERIHQALQKALKERSIKREYQALIWGHMRATEGKIELPIGRAQADRRKMTVTERRARQAVTAYALKARYKFIDHLNLRLQTGRTHQIRVHLSHLGHPLVGDREYGGNEAILNGIFDQYRPEARHILSMIDRQALHAYKLQFTHPHTGLLHTVESDLPEDLQKVIAFLTQCEEK